MYSEPLALSSQLFFCGLPVRLDSYLGCQFQCKYCYALNRGGSYHWDKVRPANPAFLKKRFAYINNHDADKLGVLSQFIKRKTPIHFGGMSDPFQKLEEKYEVTKAFLTTLQKENYPTIISTRSSLLSRSKYLRILRDFENVVIQFSFSTLNDEKSELIEPNSPKPSTLLSLMEKLSRLGIKITARWQPFIIGFSETPESFISQISSVGVKHIGFEHLKIPLASSHKRVLWPSHIKSIGVNVNELYASVGATASGRELLLPPLQKIGRIRALKQLTKKLGITFGCADNEFQYLSDTNCCCSGTDQFPGFENWYKFQLGSAVKRSLNKENISFSEIANEWRPRGSIKEFLNSNCRTSGDNSIDAHLRRRWNSSSDKFNCSSFYGVKAEEEMDSNGYRIYSWIKNQSNGDND